MIIPVNSLGHVTPPDKVAVIVHLLYQSLKRPLWYICGTKEDRIMLRVGDTAPDFSVSDHHGNTVSLGDYGNQKILLWFYPKADTPG
mgnify:CR=1 FL=1